MFLHFFGAVRQTTGSCFLLETSHTRVLIDCGIFQGSPAFQKRNWQLFKFDPRSIDALLITHAHRDHIGRIPFLVKQGFRGKIFSTPPTKDLASLMIHDAMEHLEEQARRLNRQPLYTHAEVEKIFAMFHTLSYHRTVRISDECSFRFLNAGHILGSAIIEMHIKESGRAERRVIFSGDLGNAPSPLLSPAEKIADADYLIVESVYGDRSHDYRENRRDSLEDIIEEVARDRGVLLIPSLAIERAQEILSEIAYLVKEKKVPAMPVYVDSPLVLEVLKVYGRHRDYFRKEIRGQTVESLFFFPNIHFTKTPVESKNIFKVRPPKIIIAGSGMSTAGRILHHEKVYLPLPNTIFLLVNYQVPGTLGRKILDGAKTVEILGETIPVRAKVRSIFSYSAHMDRPQLEQWLMPIARPMRGMFVVHGEAHASEALAVWARDNLGVDASIPKLNEKIELK